MDGTVLNTRKEITPRTAGAIHQALADGWEVLFATGRCLAEVRPYLTDFPDMHYLLCHSGATVTDLRTGQDLCSLPIDPETVEKVLAVTADADAAAVFFLGNELYIEERFRGRMPYFGCQCFEALYERYAHWVRTGRPAERAHPRCPQAELLLPRPRRVAPLRGNFPNHAPGVRLRHPQ